MILLGYVCLMTCLVGLILLVHPGLIWSWTNMFVFGVVFGLLGGVAHLCLIGG